MTRACCQAVANMVTANDEVANAYLTEVLQLEEKDNLVSSGVVPQYGLTHFPRMFVLT